MIERGPSECQRAVVDIAIGIFEKNTMKLPHRRQILHLAAGAAALPAITYKIFRTFRIDGFFIQ